MQKLKGKEPVEEIMLPAKYRAPASSHTWARLMALYDTLREDYLRSLHRVEEANRGQWSMERQLEAQVEWNYALRDENHRLSEAGRYAVYGKPEVVEDDGDIPRLTEETQ